MDKNFWEELDKLLRLAEEHPEMSVEISVQVMMLQGEQEAIPGAEQGRALKKMMENLNEQV